jgi:hypothetical protein
MDNMRTMRRWFLLWSRLVAGNGGVAAAGSDILPSCRPWSCRVSCWARWHADVVGQQATRKFRRCDEFRDLPDVLRLIGAVSAVAREGRKPLLLNPFTHAVELVRFALYCQINWISLAIVGAYDPSRGEPGGGT